MSLSAKQREFCKLKYKDDLTDDEIAIKVGIGARSVYYWLSNSEIQAEIKRLEDQDRESAKRESIRWARRSVKTLVKLQDIAIIKDKETGIVISEEFKFGADVARKAAVDLLEMAEVKVQKVEGEGIANNGPIFIIQSNGNHRETKDKPQDVSKRFRFEPISISGDGGGVGNS